MIRPGLLVIIAYLCHAGVSYGADWTVPESHPRLLINRDDVAGLRVKCGIDRYADHPVARARGIRFGSQRESLTRLKTIARRLMATRAGPDDLFVPAVLHVVTGEFGQPDVYTAYVASELLDPDRRRFELDAIIALDYCWDAIESSKRARITDRAIQWIEPFDPGENPLYHFSFHRKLCSLATALVLCGEESSVAEPQAAETLEEVISRAKAYLEGVFTAFSRQRGAMPTSAGSSVWEEADIVLALELWRSGTGESLWPKLSDGVGRSMEHYFYADTDYPGIDHGFIHDHGSDVPVRPGLRFEGFVPAVPGAIARRAGDPIATWYANRDVHVPTSEIDLERDRYLWVPILYGPVDQPEAARRACPLARDFGGGWVAMRGGWEDGDTVLLFDAGQPYWRARRHFDAGQFQIYRKGRLAIDSGDDVTFDAVPAKGGETMIGGRPGDWDQYAQATIAHNCVTVSSRHVRHKLYDRPWLAAGNQRLIEPEQALTNQDIRETNRWTGELTAFETNSFYSYAAADLTPAYPGELVTSMRREILFVHAGVVLVLDRAAKVRAKSAVTWHLQLPGRPRIDGRDLDTLRQLEGSDIRAGIWSMEALDEWLDVTHLEGRLFVRTLLPANANRRVAGGPMQPRKIAAGPMAGRTYFGGDRFGYGHRLWPASTLQAPNAAYELGEPTTLGPNFGVGATWGRLDVSAPEGEPRSTFLHLLWPTDAIVKKPPPTRFETQGDRAILELDLLEYHVHIEIGLSDAAGGLVSLRDPVNGAVVYEKPLAAPVQPNREIPAVRAFRP